MTMPEAPVHKYGRSEFGKHQIRPSRQLARLKSEAKAFLVHAFAQSNFWSSVPALDSRHYSRPGGLVYDVYQFGLSLAKFEYDLELVRGKFENV